MTNPYYNHTSGKPAAQTRGSSAEIRAELDLIGAGLDLLPTPTQIVSGTANYYAAGGTAQALTVVGNVAVTSYADGQQYLVKVPAAAAGASTIAVGALGVKAILRSDGSAIQASDWTANQILALTYNSTTNGFLFDQATAAQVLAAAGYAAAAMASQLAAASSAAAALVSQNAASASASTVAGQRSSGAVFSYQNFQGY